MWHDVMSNTTASHRTNHYRALSVERLINKQKELYINAVIYCQRSGMADLKSHLIGSGLLLKHIMKFLISEAKRKAEPDLPGYQDLHQDSDLELKSMRIVFKYKDNLPLILSRFRSAAKKKLLTRKKREKKYR